MAERIILIPVRGRVGKRGGSYMLYFSRDVSEFLVDYVGRDVILNIIIEDKGNCRFNIRLNATLHLTREFRP